MKTFILAATLAATTASSPVYKLDLGRYFPSPAVEQADRTALLARAESFVGQPTASLDTPAALHDWLKVYDNLSKGLRMHDLYVYLRAEEDTDDKADAKADDVLSAATERVDAALRTGLVGLGADTLQRELAADPALGPYRYFVIRTLDEAMHESRNRDAVTALATPALDTLNSSYRALRRHVLPAPSSGATPQQAYVANWDPYVRNEDAFAALLLPTVSLHNGVATLEGFANTPEQKYHQMGLSTAEVHGVLAAVRGSAGDSRYVSVLAAAAARRLHLPLSGLYAWDLDAADAYKPAAVAFPDAVPQVLAAVQPMGEEYAGQYRVLLDPGSRRVDWCHTGGCDDAGFSVGYAGMTSGLFYGAYRGSTDDIRAVAHEAGHAVHRQFMDEHQPLSMYNDGPKFMFESFAIFNEMLLLDHLYRAAPAPAAKAYYLHQLVDDMVFQVYGSAKETDLEEAIYAGVADGSIRDAKDLDALTMKVFAQYSVAPELQPEMRVYWARNRLYYVDPVYDVNYLYAGLLALEYLRQFQGDPKGFAGRYVALLKNGFDDTPQALEKRFMGIDLDDSTKLVAGATGVMDERIDALQKLYAAEGGSSR